MKSFKDFLIERRPFFAVANDYIQRKRDKEKDEGGYDPSSEGEDNFQDFHHKNTTTHSHPEADEKQFGDKGASQAQHQPSNGDREPIQQGTSKVNVPYKTNFSTAVNKGQHGGSHTAATGKDADKKGEKELKKLNGYPVQVKEDVEQIDEAMIDVLKRISSTGKPSDVKLQNGKSLAVDPKTATKLVGIHDKLTPDNRAKFCDKVSKDATSFMKMVNFAGK